MLNKVIDTIKNNGKVIYLAPSDELIEFVRSSVINKLGALYNIDVITFDDLAMNISCDFLEELDIIPEESSLIILEEILKNMHDDSKLECFNEVYDKKGFIINIFNEIKNLKDNNINYKDFFKNISTLKDEITYNKSIELAEIYKEYTNKLKELNILDLNDLTLIAIENINKTRFFDDVTLFVIDGYIDISISEMMLLKAIKNNFNIEFIYHLPLDIPLVRSFAENEILKFAKENNFEIIYDDFISDNRFKELSSVLFESDNVSFKEIEIIDSICIEDEIRQVASKIKEILIQNSDIDLSTIALIMADKKIYEEKLFDIFNEYGIYIALDKTEKFANIPLIRTLIAFLRLKTDRFNENLLKEIASSLYIDLIKRDEILYTLNYFYKGIDTVVYLDNLSENDEKLKEIKAAFIEFDEKITEKLSYMKPEAKFGEYKREIIELMNDLKLKDRIVYLYKNNDISFDLMTRDLKALFGFEDILNSLEKSYNYQNKEITYNEFIFILDSNLRDKTIILHNKLSYGVKVLTTDIVRGTTYEYVFFMGLNENIIPNIAKHKGIYSDREKEFLNECKIRINDNQYEMKKEKIRFLFSIASATKALYLSYRTADEDGSYIAKSQFLDEIMYKMKGNTSRKCSRSMKNRFELNSIYSKNEALIRYCLTREQKIHTLLSNIASRELSNITKAQNIEAQRNSEIYTQYDGKVDAQLLYKIFDDEKYSASKIMTYNNCHFKYFIEQGLNLASWDENIFSNLNIGNIYHDILADYYRKFVQSNPIYDEREIENIANKSFKKYGLVLNDILTEKTKQAILNKVKNFINIDIEFNEKINFRPFLIEQWFSVDGLVENEVINGRIDRIDLEYLNDKPTGRYIVYDYKISNSKLLRDILKGDAIQVVLYYFAAEKILRSQGLNPNCVALVYYDITKTCEGHKPKISGIIVDETRNILNITRKTNTVLNSNLEVIFTHIKKNFVENSIKGINNGMFTLPTKCRYINNYGFKCDFQDICRYNPITSKNKREDLI